ncbi:MAG: WG repeat-containing protein, partial [Clostridia bacterium]|nr:WG repeat-containing protein [Clostridia bacterium]
LSGSGTKDAPYVLDGKPVPERFEENGLYGYKDADGNVVVPAKYAKALPFSDGAALVATVEDPYRWRYIGTNGNYLFDKAFYASNNFNNGYALVLVADDPKYTYIDKTGEFATELLFDDAEDFYGGYARVQIDGKWGVVDTNFNFKVPCKYDNKDEVLGKLDLS